MSPEPTKALSADAVYRLPSGRLCRWIPGPHGRVTELAHFVYVAAHDSRHGRHADWADGFDLTPPNYRLLREVAR